MIEPTEAEKASAAHRQQLADLERTRLVAAMELCPGGRKFAQWILMDKAGLAPDHIIYCADFGDGRGWVPPCPNVTERIENHPGWTASNGFHFKPFRWKHTFGFIGTPDATYKPRTAEQLARLRVTRENKAREKLAADLPLFADEVRSGSLQVVTKNRVRTRRREQFRQASGDEQPEFALEDALV